MEREKDRVSPFGVWVMQLEEEDCSCSQFLGTNLPSPAEMLGVP